MLRVWALFLAELSAQMPASPFGHKENVPKMPAGALISPSLSAVDGLRYAARYAQLHRPQLSAEGRRVLLQDTATQGGRGLTMPAADELLPGAGSACARPFRCQAGCMENALDGRRCQPAGSARFAVKRDDAWRGLPGRDGERARGVAEYCGPCWGGMMELAASVAEGEDSAAGVPTPTASPAAGVPPPAASAAAAAAHSGHVEQGKSVEGRRAKTNAVRRAVLS